MNETLFSTIDFVRAFTRSVGHDYDLLAMPVSGSGLPRSMYAAASPAPYWSRYVWLAPSGLYASPGWEGTLERDTVERIVQRLRGPRTRGFVWNVRFDHQPLASALESLALTAQRSATHVLDLQHGYERAASGYSASIGNQIRKARRRGVHVRVAQDEEDVRAYHDLHTRLVQQKEWQGYHYPLALFLELTQLRSSVRVLVAESEGRIVAGGLFFRDGCSVMYWHGASDREYSHLFASRSVVDEAIRWACDTGAEFLNFGGSAGLASLEQFKSAWGARPELNWSFEWTNPIWQRLSRLKPAIGSLIPHRKN